MTTDFASDATRRNLDESARPIVGNANDYDELLTYLGAHRVILIGEASHGTHEFYRERIRLTRRLIEEFDVRAVAIEGDWPDAYRVNRYVNGVGADHNAEHALGDFQRFPQWMWRNRDVVGFVEWLRTWNASRAGWRERTQFYGLDLYSLRASIEAVVGYLATIDPAAARRAHDRYACFDHVAGDGQVYGYALARGALDSCEDEVVAQLLELRRDRDAYLRRDGLIAEDELFSAEQNARLVHGAESYYRQMYRADVSSWNLRDTHMADTLDALHHHLRTTQREAKVVVWAHNSHVGDARANAMGDAGEVTLGQLARERYGTDAVLVGMSTYSGHVTAASDWGAPTERKRVRPARPDSHEALFHQGAPDDYWVFTRDLARDNAFSERRLTRAIGVIYRPQSERTSHYVPASLVNQYDVVLHLDHTSALEPLERTARWDVGEPAETYPSGW